MEDEHIFELEGGQLVVNFLALNGEGDIAVKKCKGDDCSKIKFDSGSCSRK